MMREAGVQGIDACNAFRGVFASRISPSDKENPFSLSMGILVKLFLGTKHVHEALLDAKHEGIIITSLCRAILEHYKKTGQI